jgi:hypothetical protein
MWSISFPVQSPYADAAFLPRGFFSFGLNSFAAAACAIKIAETLALAAWIPIEEIGSR